MFSYNDEKHEEIEFLIYNIEGTGEDEDPGELIGKVSQKLDILVESELY